MMYQRIAKVQLRAGLALAFGLLLASGAHGQDTVKCRRAIAKNAAAVEVTTAKSLQKCNDGLLKGKIPSCPDAKASDKITAAVAKANQKITDACAGVSLTDMGFDGLSSQCNGGFTPGRACNEASDCSGVCAANGRFEGDPCIADSFCLRGLCGAQTANACSQDSDCPIANSLCTGAGTPFPCCSGVGTGSCSALNCDKTVGFCFLAQGPARDCTTTGGQCLPNGSCTGAGTPFACCTGAGTGTCGGAAPFTTCQQDGTVCDNENDCGTVDYCPSVWNDATTVQFGLPEGNDCYLPLTDSASVASCVTCVARFKAAAQVDSLFDDGAAPAHKDVLNCERTVAKSAAKHLATVRKALQKCQDGVINAGSGSCPDAKATDKITKSRVKLADSIAKKCEVEVSGPVAASIYAASGRPDPACFDRTVTSPADAAQAIECYVEASVNCDDQLDIGNLPTTPLASCNPNCGNGAVEVGETCDDGNQLNDSGLGGLDVCPSDCAVAACTDAGTDSTVTVSFAAPGGVNLFGLTVLLTYDESKVTVPGQGSEIAVQNAVLSPSFGLTPGDTDTALRVVALDPFLIGVAPGEVFTVTMDRCQGQPAPTAAEFGCMVVDTVDTTGAAVDGVTCSVSVL